MSEPVDVYVGDMGQYVMRFTPQGVMFDPPMDEHDLRGFRREFYAGNDASRGRGSRYWDALMAKLGVRA